MVRNWMDLLQARWEKGFFVCVGLDSDHEKLPNVTSSFDAIVNRVIRFNSGIIDATADLVCAFKPNFAFYLAYGLSGVHALLHLGPPHTLGRIQRVVRGCPARALTACPTTHFP